MVESAHGRAIDAASVGGCRTSSGSRLAMSGEGNHLCDEDGALLRRSRTQRHRARKHMRLIWRGYHLAKGGVHPPGLHRVETESIDESGKDIDWEHDSTETKNEEEKADQGLPDGRHGPEPSNADRSTGGHETVADSDGDPMPPLDDGTDAIEGPSDSEDKSGSEQCGGSDSHEEDCEDSDSQEEEFEDLPAAAKEADPLWNARVMMVINGIERTAQVEDVGICKRTRERVYMIRYTNGDVMYITEQQVRKHQADYEERRAMGVLYLEVLRAAEESIAAMSDRETTAEDLYGEVTDIHPHMEEQALQQPMVVLKAINKAIQQAKNLGMIEITSVSKESGPVFRRVVRTR